MVYKKHADEILKTYGQNDHFVRMFFFTPFYWNQFSPF